MISIILICKEKTLPQVRGEHSALCLTFSSVPEWGPASVTLWVSALLLRATTQSERYLSTGGCYAQGSPLVYESLLSPWNKVSFRSRAVLPVHTWGSNNSLERPKTPRPKGVVVALCMSGLPLRLPPPPGTARGDTAASFSNSATFSPSHPVYEATAHGPLPVFSALGNRQLSPLSDRDVASALSPAPARTCQEPG